MIEMVDVDKAVIARLKKEQDIFEILVDCDKALELKTGKSIGLDEVLATNEVYKDVKKGERASDHEIEKIFGTSDIRDVAKQIIQEGEIQLTAEHKNKIREEKRRQIVNLIHRNAIDPKTGLPHPPQRIENAMGEAKVHVDEHKSAEEQVESILEKIRPIIPIKFELREIEIIIPPQYGGQSYHILKKYGKLLKDNWQNDGSLMVIIEIPSGIQEDLFLELNNLAHGEVESKILKVK